MNVKLTVEYEGTRYHGWQAQAGAPTIEAALSEAIHDLTGESPALRAAGRTDAGVHALGQVVNFTLQQPFPVAQLPGALNARLAPDIAVRSAELVDDAFDARVDRTAGGDVVVLGRGAAAIAPASQFLAFCFRRFDAAVVQERGDQVAAHRLAMRRRPSELPTRFLVPHAPAALPRPGPWSARPA